MPIRSSSSMTGGAKAGSTAGAKIRRIASAESKAWLGAFLQTAREGSAVALQTLLSDLRADGHIVSSAEAEMIDEVGDEAGEELDSEIDLGEDDGAVLEGWDDESSDSPEVMFTVGADPAKITESLSIESGIELIVEGDTCRLHLPHWAGNQARTELGRRILDEVATRFLVLGRLAAWLSDERKQFLLTADPWMLGCDAIKEMRAGLVSVSPQSFLEMTGIGKMAKVEAFSRYRRVCFLVWPYATAPLAILFDLRARQSWVGNVVSQLAKEQGKKLDAAGLDRFRSVTKPRGRTEKERLLAASVDSLTFAEVLMKATLMAGVGWSEVLAEYGNHMIIGSNG